MVEQVDALIIGAGPTGLAAALFLTDLGHSVRIIDKRQEPSPFSKAFGVNARTLELLESSGVTADFLANGRRLRNVSIRRDGEVLVTFDFSQVDHPFPFLCVQSQADSERIIAHALQSRSVAIERGTELLEIQDAGGRCEAVLGADGGKKLVHARVVFAADGSTSTVRNQLGIGFSGVSYAEPWTLYDVELTTPLEPDGGHIFLLDDGGMFVVRQSSKIWRVLGNGSNLLSALPPDTTIGAILWESEFTIANRVASTFSQGQIHLGGDAAHVHAGIGARGMNLGIEDAYVFAQLLHENRLDEYDALRRPIVNKVVSQITHMMSVPRSSTPGGRIVRRFPAVVRTLAPRLRKRIQPWLLGLDHPVPFEPGQSVG
jgi:2-polyprenyl-6-methoxyphenol hydroxylase-like FAD-dependent oxidoreductase